MNDDLRESEHRYRTLADSGPALVWTSGPDKRCYYFNAPWLSFTGRTLEQELGDGWVEGVHPEDRESCVATYTHAFDRREPFRIIYRLRRHDGVYRWIQDDGVPRYDSDGRFLGYIGYCLDITDLKNEEEKVRSLLAEKDLLLKELRHRVKNDMSLVASLLSLQAGRSDHEHVAKALEEARQRVEAIQGVYQILSGSDDLSRVAVAPLVRAVVDNLTAANRELRIELTVPEDGLTVPANLSVNLVIVLNELTTNATKYASRGALNPSIHVDVDVSPEGRLSLVVADDGPGFPESVLSGEEDGLGLSMVRALVRRQRGTIRLLNHNGARVEAVLPVGE